MNPENGQEKELPKVEGQPEVSESNQNNEEKISPKNDPILAETLKNQVSDDNTIPFDKNNTILTSVISQEINTNGVNESNMTIYKGKTVEDIHEFSHPTNESNDYEKPILSIRGMEWNESAIPLENKQAIVDAINSLGDFEKIKIKGCTDGNNIDTDEGIAKNKTLFEITKEKYTALGGTCPSYQDLLQSQQDPQNTILGYRRAMEGIISLNLIPDQMRKITIDNVLGKNENDPKERGFDISADYSEKVSRDISGQTNDTFYTLLGDLKLQNVAFDSANDKYTATKLDLSTFNGDNVTVVYNKVMGNLPKVLTTDPVMVEQIQTQIKSYLNTLITSIGGKYNNGVWSAESITHEQYYTMKAAQILTKDEFNILTQNKDLSVLENKQLGNGQTIKQLLEENKDNPITSVKNLGGEKYIYNVEDGNKKKRPERYLSNVKDYALLGLYLKMNSN